MQEREMLSGVKTSFKDKDGAPITVHSYVKDAEGRKYYINSHLQAVPDDDAPAVELSRLLESSEVTVMTAKEVLESHSEEKRVRRARRRRASQESEEAIPPVKVETPEDKETLNPVTMQMLLSAIPDNILADELRRRGYYLTAVKPALVQL